MDKGKHNHKSIYTFMMVPNDESTVKTFIFPKWTLKALIYTGIIIFMISLYFIFSIITIMKEDVKKTKDIEVLMLVNEKQKSQIHELQNYTQKIKEKVNNLTALENEVKDLVGLSTSEDIDIKENEILSVSPQEEQKTKQVSRGGLFARKIDAQNQYDHSETLYQIEMDLKNITLNLSHEEDNLVDLKGDIVNQLDYLAARPNSWPNYGRITSPFGNRSAPTWGASSFHKGIDIANSYGTIVASAGSGKVIYTGWRGGYGHMVMISHGYGYTTVYAHNSSIAVKEGQLVEKGQTIAKLGNSGISTGPHVHFEIHVNGKPVDPMLYLGK